MCVWGGGSLLSTTATFLREMDLHPGPISHYPWYHMSGTLVPLVLYIK